MMQIKKLLKLKRKHKGFSLVEIVLAVGMFSLVIGSVGIFAIDAARVSRNARQRVKATLLLQEQSNAILANKRDLWAVMVDNTAAGEKHLELIDNVYNVEDGADDVDNIELGFVVENVYRNAQGDIVPQASGNIDIHTRRIVLNADWTDFLNQAQNFQTEVYVNDWNTERLVESLEPDFNSGTVSDTFIKNDGGGEIILTSVVNDDWCTPELTQATYDLPGNGIPTMLSSIPENAYLGTSGSTSSVALQSVEIDHAVDPASINVEGTYTGYNTNAIFGEENYAYLATTNDSREVSIINVSTTPFQEVGYFNASGSTDAQSVYVSGNVGYVAQGRDIRTFNLNSKTGARTQLDSVTVAGWFGYVSDITVRGNYLFAALYNDWYEMAILDVTNPSDIRVIGETDVNFQQTTDLFVNEAGTRAYFGTNSSSSYDEFFILDTTNKSGSRPIVGSFDSEGMNVKGVAVIGSHDRALIVGSGAEEYQVIDISNETNPVQCGGLQVNSGLNGATTVTTPVGDSYSYIIGNDANAEFRIVKGGPGNLGGGSSGSYAESGEFTSQIFDTGKNDPRYLSLDWIVDLPANTDLQIQLRTSDNSNMSSPTAWVGPDGTGSSFFTNSNGDYTPAVLNDKRYFQYRLYLSSDASNTPEFDQFNLNYE